MPSLKEAAVAATGTILDVEFTTDFETKKLDGNAQVLVHTADGFAKVKINRDDIRALPYDLAIGTRVSWFVRFGAWSRNDNAQATCRFVRAVNEGDLDLINSSLTALASAGK